MAVALLEEVLVEGCGADMVDRLGRTPLAWATNSGHEGMMKPLPGRKEVNPDLKDNGGRTPLWGTTEGGHVGIVRLFLNRKKVNPNSRDNGGETLLTCC